MQYLLLKLMLWGKEQEYRWFNLGMAPLAGMEAFASASVWNRIATLLYRHGEAFYNFRGLYQFKEKFDPIWEPRYLACPKRVLLPAVLTHIAALVSGGVKGIVAK